MSILQKSWLVTCLILLSTSAAQAKQDKPRTYFIPDAALPAKVRQHILQDHFVTVKTVQAIPQPVLQLLLGKDPSEGMADFGQPFQGVAIGSKNLPLRRLIFAAVADDLCLVYNEYGGYRHNTEVSVYHTLERKVNYNEYGGYGYGTQVSVYHLFAGKANLVWRAAAPREQSFLSLPQLQGKIGVGNFGKGHNR